MSPALVRVVGGRAPTAHRPRTIGSVLDRPDKGIPLEELRRSPQSSRSSSSAVEAAEAAQRTRAPAALRPSRSGRAEGSRAAAPSRAHRWPSRRAPGRELRSCVRPRGRPRCSAAASRHSTTRKQLPSRPHGRHRLHEPVQDRNAHRAPRLDVADHRLPAREAGQGRRLRADEAEEPRVGRSGRRHVPRRREVRPRAHRDEERAVPLRRRQRGALHGRAVLRAVRASPRRGRRRARLHPPVLDGADPRRQRQAVRPPASRRRSSSP